MEHVSNNLENYKKNVEERLERIKKENVTEMNNLTKKNVELTNKINELEAENTAKDKTITLLKDEMLMAQKDEFLRQQQKPELNEKSVENKGETVAAGSEETEDPVLLRVCLNRTRKDLSTAHRKITELEETYRDVVPKRELEKLDNLHQVSKREQEALIDEIKSLNREYTLVKSALETVKEQKNSLRDRCKTLAHTNTPRPDWSKCGQFIQGGVQRWRDITAKKSSEERLTILLSELCGAASAENDFFVGQGTDQSVPVFLRYKGKVKNRKLGRREVSILINDIWKNKVVADLNTPMGEYILKYFTERYHLPIMRYEWIYNLYNACQRLMYDAQIGLFWGVLWGDVAEDVYHVARKDFAVLKKMMEMRMEDKKINALLAEDIMEIVARMYPYKKNQDIENFVYAAAKQLGIDPSTEAFDIAKLFTPNEEGWERGDFGREFAKQMVQEITEFGKSILNKIDVQDKNAMIRMDVLKRGFLAEDEGIPQALLAQHLKWIYKTADLSKTKPISANVVMQRMISGYIRRYHPKSADKTES
ncbi:translin-associated factor X-interacting protein 1 isoform X2 [Cephus cinctus]|nr:translin-associated factor X-interacting protein 1 isoform X2 [Cephus cinctus]XP_024942153.1 translin-associated factor X-interacting protein 1 isoform X2 [Cephus cinctus]